MAPFYLSLLFTVFASVALANPFPNTTPKLFCEVVDLAVALLQAQTTATHFCSVYLSISTKTVTVSPTSTSTVTSITGTTSVDGGTSTTSLFTSTVPTNIITTTPTTVYTSTSTSTAVVTVTSGTVYATAYPTGCADKPVVTVTLDKRATSAAKSSSSSSSIAKPSCFSAYTSGALLSSACSCLSIATPTSTFTSTALTTLNVLATSSTTTITTVVIVETQVPILSVVTPTITTYSTTTTTSTTTIQATATGFYLFAEPTVTTLPILVGTGRYGLTVTDTVNINNIDFSLTSSAKASLFALDAACNLNVLTGANAGSYCAVSLLGINLSAPVDCSYTTIQSIPLNQSPVTCTYYPEDINMLNCMAGPNNMVESLEHGADGAIFPDGSLLLGSRVEAGNPGNEAVTLYVMLQ